MYRIYFFNYTIIYYKSICLLFFDLFGYCSSLIYIFTKGLIGVILEIFGIPKVLLAKWAVPKVHLRIFWYWKT